MSDFLVVVPTGWVEVAADWLVGSYTVEEINTLIAQESWGDLDTILYNAGTLPQGMTVAKARLMPFDSGYRLWVLFV
jgi:hypothetical protein